MLCPHSLPFVKTAKTAVSRRRQMADARTLLVLNSTGLGLAAEGHVSAHAGPSIPCGALAEAQHMPRESENRSRVTAGNGHLMPGDIHDVLQAVDDLELKIPVAELEEEINQALLQHSMRVDLSPARIREASAHRARVHEVVKQSLATLDAPATRELFDRLRFFRVSRYWNDLPVDDDIGALPLLETLEHLREIDRALEARTDDWSLNGEKSISFLSLLVGDLRSIFDAAFQPKAKRARARSFDRFARTVLASAEVTYAKDNRPFSETAISDALSKARKD